MLQGLLISGLHDLLLSACPDLVPGSFPLEHGGVSVVVRLQTDFARAFAMPCTEGILPVAHLGKVGNFSTSPWWRSLAPPHLLPTGSSVRQAQGTELAKMQVSTKGTLWAAFLQPILLQPLLSDFPGYRGSQLRRYLGSC